MKNSTFSLCSLPPVTTQCVVSELEGLGQCGVCVVYIYTSCLPFPSALSYPVTTQCVVSELEGLGQQLSGAMYVAKRFQLRNCGHHRDTQPAADCVRSMTSEFSVCAFVLCTFGGCCC